MGYLVKAARDERTKPAFLALVGRVLPIQANMKHETRPLTLRVVDYSWADGSPIAVHTGVPRGPDSATVTPSEQRQH